MISQPHWVMLLFTLFFLVATLGGALFTLSRVLRRLP